MAANGAERRRASIRTATAVLASLTALAVGRGVRRLRRASVDAAPATGGYDGATHHRRVDHDGRTETLHDVHQHVDDDVHQSRRRPRPRSTATPAAIVLPQPIAPPLDEYGVEPVIEVGSIEIPAIDVYMPMYEGIRLTTLDYGPGHWPGSAMPGHIGNTVIAGHRTSKHKVFRNLDQLAPGDEIIFDGVDGRHVYHVTSTEIIGPEAMWIVDQTPEFTATLFACHPPGSTRERIVVHADLAA